MAPAVVQKWPKDSLPRKRYRGLCIVDRGPNLQSVHEPLPNTFHETLSAYRKDNAPYQNPVHGSDDGSLRHTVSARLGAVG